MGFQIILLLVSSLMPLTWGLGVDLNCPMTFRSGINNITCKINKTAIENADCNFKQNSVTFDLTVNSVPRTVCYVAYDTPEICTGDQHQKGCFCTKQVGDIFEYGFIFQYNSSEHKHGSLECKLCVSPKTLNVTTTDSCKNFTEEGEENSPSSGGHISRTGLIVAWISLFRQLLLMLCKCWEASDHSTSLVVFIVTSHRQFSDFA
ncbi:uncharacterized protein LOC112569104 isoform X1 [Pomacea canaliculata]|uniref:uncharacterized protein LOC112569104 isoform X1 n=2 Tax=Pomacea canaliculata TaxID=400727 RepID=UPI000D72729D|nr:uncharacterized protein LOC112569104 isoform X1 [Pomacea canaliculata]